MPVHNSPFTNALGGAGLATTFGAGLASAGGASIPLLLLSLLGGGGQPDPNKRLSDEEKEILRLRAQLMKFTMNRQMRNEPIFNAVSQGIFNALPGHAQQDSSGLPYNFDPNRFSNSGAQVGNPNALNDVAREEERARRELEGIF